MPNNDNKPETIRVACLVPPDGNIGFVSVDKPEDANAVHEAWAKWRAAQTDEQKAEHHAAHTYGGVVYMRMLRSDFDAIPFDAIPADSQHWLSQ